MTQVFTLVFLLLFLPFSICYTDPVDLSVLQEFYKGLDNPEKLNWPDTGKLDPCDQKWDYVFCSEEGHVNQIEAQGVGLAGVLPKDFNKLTMLKELGLQKNSFRGALPSFSGLANLEKAYLDGNMFDEIPSDFFSGLTNLQTISLDDNQLNLTSGGWVLSSDLASSAQLAFLSLDNTSMTGQIPDFLGQLSSLNTLRLSYNNLTGDLPSTFSGSSLSTLWLNNQLGPGLTGPINIIPTMTSLQDVWLHGNQFNGKIPDSISNCVSITQIWLNSNQLVGPVPTNLTSLPSLKSLKLDNNLLMGPVPVVSSGANITYADNPFCNSQPGQPCSPEVSALLDFLDSLNYPPKLVGSWSGNDPCDNWLGVSCSLNNKVSVLNLPNFGLTGFINPNLENLEDLSEILLTRNNLTGKIPPNLTSLKSLKLLDVSRNNLSRPIPLFGTGTRLLIFDNPLIDGSASSDSPSSVPGAGTQINSPGSITNSTDNKKSKSKFLVIFLPCLLTAILLIIIFAIFLYLRHKKIQQTKNTKTPSNNTPIPHIPSNGKMAISNNAASAGSNSTPTTTTATNSITDNGNFAISLQALERATNNFSTERIIGRGGFGVVYKGELHDGTMIAVKRMESNILRNKMADEFHAEIDMLTKVRHRNLVAILGYSIESNEKLLVYEYMSRGSLSKRLFHWKEEDGSEPLDWKKRLVIALDVARGMEYLHSLGNHVFIHRDLKSANILLGHDFRAKVADFGLVKLAPDGKLSVATRLAGTFGYLAPEYAITGKITTKVDVYSFGVVLMELITGQPALDETRSDEARYLANYFSKRKNLKSSLRSIVDQSMVDLDNEETFEVICTVAELAGHCAMRDPQQRPSMGYAVNILAPLVEKWQPAVRREEECDGIDFSKPLIQLVKGWQEMDGPTSGTSVTTGLEDSKGSIPARPAGFGDSFTSNDAR